MSGKRKYGNQSRSGNRWCRLNVECLERRLLLSGSSLLGALEAIPTALVSTVESMTELEQPSKISADNQSTAESADRPSNTLTSADDTTTSGSRLGISLNLGGLASVQIGNDRAGGSQSGNSATTPSNSVSTGQVGSAPIIELSLGGGAANANSGGQSAAHGKESDDGKLIEVGLTEGEDLVGRGSTSSGGSSSPAASEQDVVNFGFVPQFMEDIVDPVMAQRSQSGDNVQMAAARMVQADSSRAAPAPSQSAQSVAAWTAKDARASDDLHAIDPAVAAVTSPNTETNQAAVQGFNPATIINTAQVAANPTITPTIVTNEAGQQLSLVARAAAAVMPVVMRVATDSAIAQTTDAETAANTLADDTESETAAVEPSAAALPVIVNLAPTNLLAIVPGDLRAVDQALERLLDEIDAIGGDLVDYAAGSDLLQWTTAGAGVAACVGGAYFHRKRRYAPGQSPEEESANWMFARMQSLVAGGD